jgi:hypothetical protein
LRQEEDAFEVNVDHRIEVRLGHFLKVDVLRIARIVHKVVEPVPPPGLERLADIRDESTERPQITGVEAKRRPVGVRALTELGFAVALHSMSGRSERS